MKLKELRIEKGLTQKEASSLLGVSLRSYKQYENDESKSSCVKYKYFIDTISKYKYIDETHGVLSLDKIKSIVARVLSQYDVDYCYLFGSYATSKAHEKSDVDLLIHTSITGMAFFGLAEELREALHKKVDLLNQAQLNNNPTLIKEVLMKGLRIYVRKQ